MLVKLVLGQPAQVAHEVQDDGLPAGSPLDLELFVGIEGAAHVADEDLLGLAKKQIPPLGPLSTPGGTTEWPRRCSRS